MNCKKCGQVNEEGTQFCVDCGSPLTTKSNKKVVWVIVGLLGLFVLCAASGLLIGGGVWLKDYLMTPEQRVEKALQGDTAREVNDQLQKIPKNTKGRDKVVKHYFDVSKREALQSDTYPLIAETINEFRQNGLDVKELEEHASKVMERQEQEYAKQQQEEARRKHQEENEKYFATYPYRAVFSARISGANAIIPPIACLKDDKYVHVETEKGQKNYFITELGGEAEISIPLTEHFTVSAYNSFASGSISVPSDSVVLILKIKDKDGKVVGEDSAISYEWVRISN